MRLDEVDDLSKANRRLRNIQGLSGDAASSMMLLRDSSERRKSSKVTFARNFGIIPERFFKTKVTSLNYVTIGRNSDFVMAWWGGKKVK